MREGREGEWSLNKWHAVMVMWLVYSMFDTSAQGIFRSLGAAAAVALIEIDVDIATN